ncbi:hypothetical protein [Rhodococcus sp. SJ-3]|uniref:hypothetical protein n=1 Tax=Rhodococcus sp. SJ-3 TaxID=3454628 RepID=UPI003F7B062F
MHRRPETTDEQQFTVPARSPQGPLPDLAPPLRPGSLPAHPAAAAFPGADVLAIVEKARAHCQGWADEVLERRGSAILLLGFAWALPAQRTRRADPGGRQTASTRRMHRRMRISETDQEGRGHIRALPFAHAYELSAVCVDVVGPDRGRLRHRRPSRQ